MYTKQYEGTGVASLVQMSVYVMPLSVDYDMLLIELIYIHLSKFLRGIVRHSPDLYLDEMRELLETHCGVEVTDSTVWRALSRTRFTMKKV